MKFLMILSVGLLSLTACEENTGKFGGALSQPNVTSQNLGIYVNTNRIDSLMNMSKTSNGRKPRDCKDFSAQGSVLNYNLYGLNSRTNGDFTEVLGEEFRVIDTKNKVVAKLFQDSTFEYNTQFLKRSFNRFNQPLRAILTNNKLIINFKSSPITGDQENLPGSVVFEKVELSEFEELNAALTFYCR